MRRAPAHLPAPPHTPVAAATASAVACTRLIGVNRACACAAQLPLWRPSAAPPSRRSRRPGDGGSASRPPPRRLPPPPPPPLPAPPLPPSHTTRGCWQRRARSGTRRGVDMSSSQVDSAPLESSGRCPAQQAHEFYLNSIEWMQSIKLTSLSDNEERKAERSSSRDAERRRATVNRKSISGSYPSHSSKIDIRVVPPSRAT